MTAINPTTILSQLADNEPAVTHTYILNGTQQTDTYTAGEIIKYLESLPMLNKIPLSQIKSTSTSHAAALIDKYIF